MRLIDADKLQRDLMKYVVKGYAESPVDCAEFNRMIKDAKSINVKKRIKNAIQGMENYKVVDGYIHVQIYEVEQAIDKALDK